jgi:hypothetical protein
MDGGYWLLEEECVVVLLRFVSDCAWNTSTSYLTQLIITVDGQTSLCEGDDSTHSTFGKSWSMGILDSWVILSNIEFLPLLMV